MSCTATLGYSSTWPWWSWGPRQNSLFSVHFPATIMSRDRYRTISWNLHMSHPDADQENYRKRGTVEHDVFSGSDPSWTLSGMHVRPSIQEKIWQWMKEWWHTKQTQEWLSTWKPSQPGGASSCLFLRTHQMDIQSGTKMYNCSNLLSPVFLRSSFLPLFWIFLDIAPATSWLLCCLFVCLFLINCLTALASLSQVNLCDS